jgi:PAS domain S-box-containing protein
MSTTQDLIQPRAASYFKSSLYTRWIAIFVVAGSFWFLPGINWTLVIGLAFLATFYNIVLMIAARRGWNALVGQRLTLSLDSLLSLLLIGCTGGIDSPYLFILVLVIVSAAYWYGARVALAHVAVQAAVLIAQLMIQHPETAFPRGFVVEMLVLASIGLYVALLTRSERSERSKLITIGTEAENERQQLLALINNMGDAVLVIGNDSRVAIHNQAAATLAGSKDIQGQPLGESLHFVDAEGKPAELKLQRGSAAEQRNLRLKATDGSIIAASVNIAPYIVDRQNRGHVLIIHDVSQETTIDQERKEFIAVASHELRTPLTVAQGDISFLLSDAPKDAEQTELLNGALRSLQQLSHIISDLTNLAQVENEQLDVQVEPLNPIALLHDFQSDYTSQAKEKGLELNIDIDPHLTSATILTSRYVVREIISIFLTNAIKFTEKGSVTIRVMNPKDESAGVTFAVRDTGIGISQSDQKKIFKKFFQSEDYSTRVHGGTGLGLYIAQRLAKRITAKLWFETKLGEGSTFYLWVPPYTKHKQDSGKVAAAQTKEFLSSV